MKFSTVIWDAQSGVRLAQVKASSGEWQRGRVTEQRHEFKLVDLALSRAELHNLFGKDRPRDRVLSVLWGQTPIYHGLIIDSEYTHATQTLSVAHKDVRELSAARWLFGIGGSGQTFNFTGSWRGIAREIAKVIYTDPISPAWPLPVALPPFEGGGAGMTVYGYEFRSGDDLLTDIEDMDNGPDLDFHPTFNGSTFGWELRIGAPHLSGPTFEYHLQAIESPLTDLTVKTVGEEKVTGVHGIGLGSEWDMVRGGAAAPVSAGLARDTKLTLKDADLGTVNARSAGFLASRIGTYEQWSFNVRTNEIDLAALRLGSTIRIESRGDLWVPDGFTTHRVLGFSGDYSTPETIKLTTEKM